MSPRFAANAALIAVLLNACSDPKAANEANFRQVIEPTIKDRFCRLIHATEMRTSEAGDDEPFPIILTATPERFAGTGDRDTRAMLESAARDGFLKRETRTAPARPKGNTSSSCPPHSFSTRQPKPARPCSVPST